MRLAAFCSVFNKFWDLAPPLLIGLAVDVVVLREDSTLANVGLVDPWHQLVALSVLTFLIWGLESLFEYFYGVLWRNLAQTVQHELRLDTFDHVQQQGMTWFDERQKGDILAILNDDINQLERFLDKGANDLLQVSTTVIVVGAVFLLISWQVALFAVLPIPLIVWGSFRYQRSLEPRYAKVRQAAGQMNALLENDLSGMSTVQSFTAEANELRRVEVLSDAYREANREAIRLSAAFTPLIRMAILVGFTATLLLGGWFTLEGTMAVGAYSVLVFMTQRLLWPLTRLGETFDLYQRHGFVHPCVGRVGFAHRTSARRILTRSRNKENLVHRAGRCFVWLSRPRTAVQPPITDLRTRQNHRRGGFDGCRENLACSPLAPICRTPTGTRHLVRPTHRNVEASFTPIFHCSG